MLASSLILADRSVLVSCRVWRSQNSHLFFIPLLSVPSPLPAQAVVVRMPSCGPGGSFLAAVL